MRSIVMTAGCSGCGAAAVTAAVARQMARQGKRVLLAEATAGRIIAAEDRVYATWAPTELAAYLTLTERYLSDLRRECDSLQK